MKTSVVSKLAFILALILCVSSLQACDLTSLVEGTENNSDETLGSTSNIEFATNSNGVDLTEESTESFVEDQTETENVFLNDLTFYLLGNKELYEVGIKERNNGKDNRIEVLNIPATFNGKPVVQIKNSGFKNLHSLTDVTLPEGIIKIGSEAFSGCKSLKKVIIPSTVTNIDKSAFKNCTDLEEIRYNGTIEDWNGIQFGKDWDHKVECYIYCTDGIINPNNEIETYPSETSSETSAETSTELLTKESTEETTISEEETSVIGETTTIEDLTTEELTTEELTTEELTTDESDTNEESTTEPHTHSFGDWEIIKNADCTNIGEQKRACACGEVETQNIDPVGHTEVTDDAVAPTCTETGLTEGKHCSVCGEVLVEQEIVDALGHTAGANATCTTTQNCTVCGEVLNPALGHTEVTDEAVAPTCTDTGLTEGKHCSVCGEVLVDQKIVVALGHTAGADATCTTTQNCTVCGEVLNPALGHTEVTDEAVAPTCTETGLTDGKHCSVCGEVLVEQDIVAALGHTAGADATCTTTQNCTVCGEVLNPALGHTEVIDKAVDPTCTETGLTEGKHCSVCKEILVAQEIVSALGHTAGADATCTSTQNCTICGEVLNPVLGHTEVTDEAVDPTCTETGLTKGKHCSVCGEVLVEQDIVAALGHTAGADATCTTTQNCTVCGEVLNPALGHTEITDEAAAPTCTETGLTEGKHCSVCGEVLVEQDIVAALGHTAGADATCTTTQNCTVCGEVLNPALGHTEITDEAAAPTCTETGLTEGKHCSVCGEVLVEQKIVAAFGHTPGANATCTTTQNCTVCGEILNPALGHTEVTDEAVAPTCTETGLTDGKHCSVCGETLVAQQIIDALGHTAGAEATCTTTQNCTVCGEVLNPALGHSEVIDVAVASTCTKTGLTEGKHCSVCGEVLVAQETINALGHIEVSHESKEPTCTEIGWDSYVTCDREECEYSTYLEKPALGHNYVDKICTNCGKLKPSEGLEFTLSSDKKSYYVSGIGTCTDTDVVIPDTYNGLPVTEIGNSAFSGCININSIIIPDSVISISYNAFYGCSSLIYVSLPDSVTQIRSNAFYNCSRLTSITIPDGITSIDYGTFYNCINLTSVTIPKSVTYIGDNSFKNCYKLIEIYNQSNITIVSGDSYYNGGIGYYAKNIYTDTIGESKLINEDGYIFYCDDETSQYYLIGYIGTEAQLTLPDTINHNKYEIYIYAFYNNDKITTVTIPNSVTSIGGGAFYDCTRLTSITILASVTSIGGSTFYDCANLTSITIPASVTSIGQQVFHGCSSLASITIPASVTSIGDRAFGGCSNLTSITIPASVTSIGQQVFHGCSSLASINVSEGNSKYHSDGNCLISTKQKMVIAGCKNSVIPSDGSVTSIGNYAFSNCTTLKNITIPDSITKIFDHAFWLCSGFTNIYIPNSVSEIGTSAFQGCSKLLSVTFEENNQSLYFYSGSQFAGCLSLTTINIPDGATSISHGMFSGCSSLTSITIPDSVTSIGNYAFSGCSSLTNITIPDSVISIGSSAFSGCSSLMSITIPDSVTVISNYAFYGCSSLASIVIPDSVTSIGNHAFSGCRSLTNITIPDSVTSIGEYAFWDCSSLTSINIPDGVTSIGSCAFNNCSSLKTVYYTGTEEEWAQISISSSGNNYLTNATIIYNYVPEGE